jgi:hypothetical protein
MGAYYAVTKRTGKQFRTLQCNRQSPKADRQSRRRLPIARGRLTFVFQPGLRNFWDAFAPQKMAKNFAAIFRSQCYSAQGPIDHRSSMNRRNQLLEVARETSDCTLDSPVQRFTNERDLP